MTWEEYSDGSYTGLKAQLFDSSGSKLGGEILVNTTIAGFQRHASVAGLPSGGFVAVWTNFPPFEDFGSAKLQLFDAAGAKIGAEILVNATDSRGFSRTDVAVLADGFVVTWAQQDPTAFDIEYDVRAQRFDFSGAKVGAEVVVHASTPGNQGDPDVDALPGGGFIITWRAPGQDGSLSDVYGQIFDSAGGRVGTEFIIGTVADGRQAGARFEVMPSGDIVIVWSDESFTGGDVDGYAVKSQILTASVPGDEDIVLSATTLSENAAENLAVARVSATWAVNSLFTYEIVSDSTGGAFRIDGDQLVVDDNAKLDFETAPQAAVIIRATDINGQSYDEQFILDVTDIEAEKRWSAGDRFAVNTTSTADQSSRTAVALAGGGFALFWIEYNSEARPGATLMRVYDSAGEPVAGEIVVGGWGEIDVAALADGGFVLVRAAQRGPNGTTIVEARIFDSTGNQPGPEFFAGTDQGNYVSGPAVVELSDGDLMIAWVTQTGEVHAQRFDSAGTETGAEIVVTTVLSAWPMGLVATPDGGFAASWIASDGNPDEARVQFFDSAGVAAGPYLSVNLGLDSGSLTLLALAGGGYVLGWRELVSDNGSGVALQAVRAQIIGADGAAIGEPVLLSNYAGEQDTGKVSFAAHPDGGFVATWPLSAGTSPAALDSMQARLFDASGSPVGPQFEVSATTWNDTGVAIVLTDGSIVGSWTGTEGIGSGVYARIFKAAGDPLGTEGDDQLYGDEGANTLDGREGDDQLFGFGGDDNLIGGADGDLLDGGAGADSMAGGTGNDSYVVDDAGDVVTENAGEGTDEIRTDLAAFSLANLPNVEYLTGLSELGQSLTGNAADNIVNAGGGNDFVFLQAGGNDYALGNQGNDVFLFGASMNSADQVDGGDGIDQIVLQGNYAGETALYLDFNVSGIENLAILAGSDTRFGDPGTNSYDYEIAVSDSVLGEGVQLVIDANRLRAGEDLTVDGSAETDGSFFIYGGNGVDRLTGGAKNDVFIFGGQGQFGSGDVLVGGDGIDQLGLRGNYTITFGAGQLLGIEQIGMVSAQDTRYGPLGSSYSYDLTMVDGNVDSIQMTVDAAPLRAGETLKFNGSAEDDGSFRVFGGRDNDIIVGSRNGDILAGNGGADSLTGGAGADVFRYVASTDSAVNAKDQILDFLSGTDKIDLGRIDADVHVAGDQAFHIVAGSAFTGAGASSAGELLVYGQAGIWHVEGDTDGDGNADFSITLFVAGQLDPANSDFLL
ncbi:MAG TPA: M10 family metallopeptidase C-terminal domain-containing protein [Allosphingosinicella sp.]